MDFGSARFLTYEVFFSFINKFSDISSVCDISGDEFNFCALSHIFIFDFLLHLEKAV